MGQRIELTTAERVKFLELMAKSSSSGQFEIRLGLSRRDVEIVKAQLGIEDADQARRLLRKEEERLEKEALERNAARVESTREDQRRQRRQSKRDTEDRRTARSTLRKQLDPTAIKQEDRERQKRFEAQQEDFSSDADEDWQIEEGDVEKFTHDIQHRGIGFAADKHGVSRAAIRNEVKRLGLAVDLERVRR